MRQGADFIALDFAPAQAAQAKAATNHHRKQSRDAQHDRAMRQIRQPMPNATRRFMAGMGHGRCRQQ